jgi:hypothetical protein
VWVAALVAAITTTACGGPRVPPHRNLDRMWRAYADLPDERALVVGGDPHRLWVAGTAGGAETADLAEERATQECKRRRRARRIGGLCRTYAIGDRIVWDED